MGLASALSTALTGLSASETMVDVAGNNVANANTVGFKQSSAVFTTQFLQTMSLGTAPSGNRAARIPSKSGWERKSPRSRPTSARGRFKPVPVRPIWRSREMVSSSCRDRRAIRSTRVTVSSRSTPPISWSTPPARSCSATESTATIRSTAPRSQPLTIPIGGTSVAQATQNVYLQGDLSPTDAVATHAANHRLANAERCVDRDPTQFDVERRHGDRSGRRQQHNHRRQHDRRKRCCRHL